MLSPCCLSVIPVVGFGNVAVGRVAAGASIVCRGEERAMRPAVGNIFGAECGRRHRSSARAGGRGGLRMGGREGVLDVGLDVGLLDVGRGHDGGAPGVEVSKVSTRVARRR
jgi:hypothetical protein